MNLSDEALQRTREVLLNSDPLAIARHVTRLHFGGSTGDVPSDVAAAVRQIGWVDPEQGGLTEIGWFAADSCREYVFWRERERKLPFADLVPKVISEQLVGKQVLEVGSGSGMNLLSMSPVVTSVVGLEPVGVYRQLGAVFAEVEGLANVDAVPGSAEALPFPDAEFDTVICVTAHQYFDISPALNEIARVLRPGGNAVLIGGTLSTYAIGSFGQLLSGVGAARNYGVTVANTLGYMLIGRRVIVRPSKWSTAFPVYPSRRAMVRLLRKAGLDLVEPPIPIAGEAVFRARKQG